MQPFHYNSCARTLVLSLALIVACNGDAARNAGDSTRTAMSPGDSAFGALSQEIIEDFLTRNPSAATDLGVHKYDNRLEDMSESAVQAESKALARFTERLAALDSTKLSAASQSDRVLLIHSLTGRILANDVIRRWSKDPDAYSSMITNAAYVIMKRPYAPQTDRLRSLLVRMRSMPVVLVEARKNLKDVPRIYADIAAEQVDGNVSFFRNDLPAAFGEVTDSALLRDFRQANDTVMAALMAYKKFIQTDVIPKANGAFAYGPDAYARALSANEMIDLPLERLLQIAEADRQLNERAFQATAQQIDATRSADAVLANLQKDHPAADKLLATTQATLDSLRQFIVDHHIITIPESPPAKVLETPPFQRSTTSASMETPGPFEPAKLEARYNMTLPDPRWPAAKQDDFMRQWYYAAISNVSVHEVYPGHYTQFLYAKQFPGDVRKIYGANTNIEGWAHYDEQMMFDEGFHATEPKYHLAQLQDALLRDVRFIVGIKMHTQGMTVAQATALFESQAHQPKPVAESEAKRGTADALYGYYTMGKLMILKLRNDYKVKLGAQYSLQKFHDEFIKLGPLPLPLIRKAMLGSTGDLF